MGLCWDLLGAGCSVFVVCICLLWFGLTYGAGFGACMLFCCVYCVNSVG